MWTKEAVAEARGWISDCVWGDLTASQIKRLSKERVIDGIRRHYVGGEAQFLRDWNGEC
jgi:hypothetical protein